MIQNLENFVSIAIQGIQVPMYTKHTLFLYFSDFSLFFLFLFKNKNKIKTKQPNKTDKQHESMQIDADADAWNHDSKSR